MSLKADRGGGIFPGIAYCRQEFTEGDIICFSPQAGSAGKKDFLPVMMFGPSTEMTTPLRSGSPLLTRML